MHDLLLHELGARRVHWRYDDPSGIADVDARTVRGAGRPAPAAIESRLRIRRRATPKAA
jgi:hypothetical protein